LSAHSFELLIVGVPVIKCFLCIGIGNFGINQTIVIGEIGGSSEVEPFKSFFGLVLLDKDFGESDDGSFVSS
jgi:hypothetical protein